MKIGFHLPISKGFEWTLKEAKRLQCDVAQIFVKNPRSWEQKKLKTEDIKQFKKLSKEVPVFAHLSYLPNIAKIDEDKRHIGGFIHEVNLCTKLGVNYLVVHCGSRADREAGIRTAAKAIDIVLDRHNVSILLENASGQGSSIGRNITELAMIFDKVKKRERVLLCLDTAHLFQSGYDLRAKKSFDLVISEINRYFGIDRIGLFHLNDSKTPMGSGKDRHWHIGKGEMGLGVFNFIIKDKKFAHLSGVMETPKMGKMDEENMRIMRSLLSPLVSCSPS